MLSGVLPFRGSDIQVQKAIITCNYSYGDEIWDTISEEAKDWIDNLMRLKPEKRYLPD